jgi:hypothetical protein
MVDQPYPLKVGNSRTSLSGLSFLAGLAQCAYHAGAPFGIPAGARSKGVCDSRCSEGRQSVLGDRCAHPRQEPAEPRLEDIDSEAFGVATQGLSRLFLALESLDCSGKIARLLDPLHTWVRFEDREQSAKLRGHAEGFGIDIFQARFRQFLGSFPITRIS